MNQLAIPNSFVTGATVSTDVEGKIIAGNVGSILNSLNPEVTRKAQELAVTKAQTKSRLFSEWMSFTDSRPFFQFHLHCQVHGMSV
ncbi:MAG: hypothetical protein IPF54_10225 [Draconibacterium sp.]|nr:hypothetical protein [Draconibacterium sp.]